jgi:hypothetical protein
MVTNAELLRTLADIRSFSMTRVPLEVQKMRYAAEDRIGGSRVEISTVLQRVLASTSEVQYSPLSWADVGRGMMKFRMISAMLGWKPSTAASC